MDDALGGVCGVKNGGVGGWSWSAYEDGGAAPVLSSTSVLEEEVAFEESVSGLPMYGAEGGLLSSSGNIFGTLVF